MKKVILSFFCTSLFAGPPMHSSDPFVPALNEYEINIALSSESGDETLYHAPIIDLNYGLVKDVQITLETAYTHTQVENDFDSFELAVKWNFYQDDFLSVAIYPKYVSYPVESIFSHGEDYELSIPVNIVLNKQIDLVIDTTYVMPFDGVNHFELGTYLKYKVQKHNYYIEIFMEEESYSFEFLSFGSVGYLYQFHENVAFMISYGVELMSRSSKATTGYTGLQFVF